MIATMCEREKDSTPTTTTACLTLEDIHFADNDLSRPLYRTLFNYPEKLTDQVQVDLGFQVGLGLDELKIKLKLREGAGVSFTPEPADPTMVKLRDLADPDEAPSDVAARFDDPNNPLVCTFTWNRPQPQEEDEEEVVRRVRAFRLFCQEEGFSPSVQEIVYGGLFLAIIDYPRLGGAGFKGLLQTTGPSAPMESLTKLKLLGIDDWGRPMYNLFDYSKISLSPADADLEIEPTYRVYERQEFRLDFDLNVPAIGPWTFNGELKFLNPPNVRSLFAYTFPKETSSRFSWTRKDAGLESSEIGSASTFHLGVDPADLPDPVFEALEEELEITIPSDPDLRRLIFRHFETVVDPTIIEPPRCTDGICVG